MGQHKDATPSRRRARLLIVALAGTAALTGALSVTGGLTAPGGSAQNGGPTQARPSAPAGGASTCPQSVRVAAPASFASVLRSLAPSLAERDQCVRLDLVVADGRSAPTAARDRDADVWIADDTAWRHLAPQGLLPPPDEAGQAGTVLATSPLYMVTDESTRHRMGSGRATWLRMAELLQSDPGVRLVVKEPAASGDGMLGVGAVAEGVWRTQGMDASAVALERIVPRVRTASGGAALPRSAGEVGVVPEYALLPALRSAPQRYAVLPGSDFTAELRYTFFPTAKAQADPQRAAVVERLRAVLTGPAAPRALGLAGLRPPGAAGPPGPDRAVTPATTAPVLNELPEHHVDHVFASWYRADRRLNLTMVVDVSWSMSERAPGSSRTTIDLVRRGSRTVAGMLPDASRVGLWAFGSHLSGTRDYRVLRPIGALTAKQRRALDTTVRGLAPEHTGTGLHDTILAAYLAAQKAWTPGRSNQVMVFTDGVNEDDPGSIDLAQLTRSLERAQDRRRPVQLSVVGFGRHAQLDALGKALEPVGAYVESLTTAQEVQAMFIHVATGGLHAEAGA